MCWGLPIACCDYILNCQLAWNRWALPASLRHCLSGLGLLAGMVMSSAALFLAGGAALAGAATVHNRHTCLSELLQDMLVTARLHEDIAEWT